jgi:hypothetical protein
METQERLLVDARATWKPYRVACEVIKALRPLGVGSVVEVLTKADPGLLTMWASGARPPAMNSSAHRQALGRRAC